MEDTSRELNRTLKIDDEAIDRLFKCMHEFYGERWSKQFTRNYPEPLLKTIWKSALLGLEYGQVKTELVNQKRRSAGSAMMPPDCLAFYGLAKRHPRTGAEPVPVSLGCSEVGKQTLADIRKSLKG